MAFGGTVLAVLASVLAVALAVLLIMFVLVPLFKGVGWGVRQVFNFVFGEIGDALRIVGAVITNVVFIPLVVGSVIIGRWSAAAHFGRAIQSEFKTMGACLYRITIGHPARLLCLTALTDGIEKRLPEVVAAAPGADRPSRARAGQFEGYTIVGSLPGGGSGGRLYVANPDELKLATFARNGQHDVGQVVIKAFSLRDGSSLPQIVRESRALDAAKKLGLVLEHELTDERFFYITRYVPGESLGLVTQRLHAQSPADGLGPSQLRQAMACGADLLRTLDTYHRGGLWHKDVKPDNIIVDGRAAHLVDFGLITPLRSAMTLTTHGTEYFRDPEMVRLALKGVKVHQVDGAKFDLYAAGAVLFSVIENSFPAHGGLSQVSKKCPEALRWIIRRAMTEYDRRYVSAAAMLADLETVRRADDPFAVRPADLPSMRQEPAAFETLPQDAAAAVGVAPAAAVVGHAAAAVGHAAAAVGMAAMGAAPVGAAMSSIAEPAMPGPAPQDAPAGRLKPRIRVAHWWTGRYNSDSAERVQAAAPGPFVFQAGFRDGKPFVQVDRGQRGKAAGAPVPPPVPGRGPVRRVEHKPAGEQLASARARVESARERARQRMASRRAHQAGRNGQNFQSFNPGVAAALFVFLGGCVALVGGVLFAANGGMSGRSRIAVDRDGDSVRTWASLPLPVPPATPSPAPEAPEAERPMRSGSRVELLSPQAQPMDGTVLFLTDVLPPYAEKTGQAIDSAYNGLVGAGLTVVGNYTEEGSSDEAMMLEAEVREVRGAAPLDSDETRRALGDWLSETESADFIVWLTANQSSPSKVQADIFPPTIDERARPKLAKRIKGLGQRIARELESR